MILSVHIADVGARATLGILRARPASAAVPGLRYAETLLAAPLSGSRVPTLELGRVGLIAAWEDDAALDRFLADHPLARRLSGGWHVRLEPLRVSGTWSALPGLPGDTRPHRPEEPVGVLTLGRLRLTQTARFLASSATASAQALADPALLAGTGLARPPRLVATFSLWRTAEAMRAYAYGRAGGEGHPGAIRAHRAKAFHHESAFLRFRPYGAHGTWDGHDPLAAVS